VLSQVLSGLGGVGKTQLAAQFARQLRDDGAVDLLVWVTASSREAILAGYAQATAALDLDIPNNDIEHAANRFMSWLGQTNQRWLVVLDDLSAPTDLADWWPPPNPQGRTLVTTRRRDAALRADGRVLYDVGLFSPDEALSYLMRALTGRQRSAEAELLAADLGYLPLALAQAAAYIADRDLDCVSYRRRLTDRKKTLAQLLPEPDALPDGHRVTVDAAWALSVEAADHLNPTDTRPRPPRHPHYAKQPRSLARASRRSSRRRDHARTTTRRLPASPRPRSPLHRHRTQPPCPLAWTYCDLVLGRNEDLIAKADILTDTTTTTTPADPVIN
jgi:hypothetical protein